MKALIIDDEALARKRVINLLNKVPEIEVLGECASGKIAVEQINSLSPDLIFLDLEMKDMDGFEVLEKIEISPRPAIVFLTAHNPDASRVFDANVCDLLLKPFKEERFYKTVSKVLNTVLHEELDIDSKIQNLLGFYTNRSTGTIFKIPVKQGNKTILVDPRDILYIISSGCYAEIYTHSKKYLLRESLCALDEILDPNLFFRIHRSAIVNLDHVKELVHSEYGEIDAKMADGRLLHTSKAQKKPFLEKLGI
ncbi:LytR/AlgR family response regulator transcription factor [Salinimicrobium sp. TH3]|uniref:LytR/AlgR family response regulator transcription factor n=1 Tax=Salinimicrobium sp. TH3 TaxID=2997342 RepID=UPI002273CBD3|nr:LytTR family DNA-binding domain-containing protein [Salinimicrobium sp. TH3]MCY2688655.1 LytTR family DNA-binding domain-containing protein [Salinimicrobium sp. TH3]